MNLIVVVCHFKENLDWVSELKHPYIIYNKNSINSHKFEHNLPNIGFDTYTYLSYIVDHYTALPDYVCFAQDYPFDHCSNFIELVNEFDSSREFQPLGLCFERSSIQGESAEHCSLRKALALAERINLSVTLPINFVSSAQCIVSKNLILKRSAEFYQSLFEVFCKRQPFTDTNYSMEYLWPTILNFSDKLITGWTNSSSAYNIKKGSEKPKTRPTV